MHVVVLWCLHRRAESQSGLSAFPPTNMEHYNYYYAFQKLLMIHVFLNFTPSLYGMYNFYLIFGHVRQFPILTLWVSPLWFSTLV